MFCLIYFNTFKAQDASVHLHPRVGKVRTVNALNKRPFILYLLNQYTSDITNSRRMSIQWPLKDPRSFSLQFAELKPSNGTKRVICQRILQIRGSYAKIVRVASSSRYMAGYVCLFREIRCCLEWLFAISGFKYCLVNHYQEIFQCKQLLFFLFVSERVWIYLFYKKCASS